MDVSLKASRLGIRNSTTRIPFRYGSACMTKCPQALLEVTVETSEGISRGWAADCLPPLWFDKTPGKTFRQQVDEMLGVIDEGQQILTQRLERPSPLFPAWHDAYSAIQQSAAARNLTPLLASFGLSMSERAVMDALCRARQLPFHRALQENVFCIQAGAVHKQLEGVEPKTWIASQPANNIAVRHTVGLGDPLTTADVADDERLNDGLPQTLEEYVERNGIRYFKIKVSNQLEHDLDRLRKIIAILENRLGQDYHVTLDGNEQYKSADELNELIDRLRTDEFQSFFKRVLVLEQPLERRIALDAEHAAGIRALGDEVPVIIDESDGELDSFARAVELGYRGVSSKNCKGPFKSILNAGLIWQLNEDQQRYVMTGEDLCCVGVVSVQADLCLVSTLGLTHVERNGHHFHPGLTYLPESQRAAAMKAHGDFYHQQGQTIGPRIANGEFQIGSLHQTGFGFNWQPDWNDWQSTDSWQFESLGLD